MNNRTMVIEPEPVERSPESEDLPTAAEGLNGTDVNIGQLKRELELFANVLLRYLKLSPGASTAIRVYIDRPLDSKADFRLSVAANGGSQNIDPEAALEMHLSECSTPEAAVCLTRCLVESWYGGDAAGAHTIIHGITGLALANSSVGPALDVYDAWVLSELKAGTLVSVSGACVEPENLHDLNKAAVSFVAFLHSNSDADSLHRYLTGYDPARQDAGSLAAYNRPLAVLEEEWLGKLRRRTSSTDSLLPFLRQITPLLKPYRSKQVEILIYLFLAAGFTIVQPYAVKVFIDRISVELSRSKSASLGAGAILTHHLVPFLIVLALIYAASGLVSLRRAYTVNWLNQTVLNNLQIRMYEHLQRLSHRFYNDARIADLMSRISDDLENVQSALSQVTNKALYQCFTVAGALTALMVLSRKSPALAVAIVAIIPLFAANYVALRTRNKQASRDQRKSVSQTMTVLLQDLQAHALVKAFGMEKSMLSMYQGRIRALQKSKLRLALLSALTDLSEDMTMGLAQLVVFGIGGYLVLRYRGTMLSIGDLAAVLLLVKSIFSPIASLSGIGQTLQQATGSMERVEDLLNQPITIAEKPDAVDLQPLEHGIRFDNVMFGYDRPALTGLTLTIAAHSHVAIVGPSGAGKSTIVNLLLRFWDVDSGSIQIDGHDLRDVTLASLRRQIGLVFQETFILDTTLRANIAIGRPDATDAEIAAAAKAAQLDTFIVSLPAGYDTIAGENGSKLSVGQKQRIAIARVFLRNPPILIMDEATSALDASKEAGIFETLTELAKGRTTISVTHRIVQAATTDRIFVINEGRLVQEGTHEELLRVSGIYSELYRQATGTKLEVRPELIDTEGHFELLSANTSNYT